MNLDDAKTLIELHMEAHSLIAKGWRFMFDTAVTRFGRCYYKRKLLTLSSQLVQLNLESTVEQTILHEIAHAVVGPGHNHGPVWRRKAIELGHNGNRCYDPSVVMPKAPWVQVCDTCGRKLPMYLKREDAATRSCGRCSPGKFNEKFILRWERNS